MGATPAKEPLIHATQCKEGIEAARFFSLRRGTEALAWPTQVRATLGLSRDPGRTALMAISDHWVSCPNVRLWWLM